jgi:hypothetical protein
MFLDTFLVARTNPQCREGKHQSVKESIDVSPHHQKLKPEKERSERAARQLLAAKV